MKAATRASPTGGLSRTGNRDSGVASEAPSHLRIPASGWPRGQVYYYCPQCCAVHAVAAAAPAACPRCARQPLRDIFAEMAARLERAFAFFDATRSSRHPWLFVAAPGEAAPVLSVTSMALGAFGELRAMGFTPPRLPPWDADEEVLNAWTGAILEHRDPATNLLRVPDGDGAVGGAVASPERYVSSGFEWQLRNRVFMADRYRLPAGAQSNRDYLATVDQARRWLEETWAAHPPWTAGSWTSRAVETHLAWHEAPGGHQGSRQDTCAASPRPPAAAGSGASPHMGRTGTPGRSAASANREGFRPTGAGAGGQPRDAVIDFVQRWLEERQDRATGAWYAGVESPHDNVVNGIFKLFVTYERLGWEIPRQRAIVDFVLGGADRARGFSGQGCSVFDPMQVLYVLRCRGNDHRASEVDTATAASFLTFLDNWDESTGWFREGTWHGKHNLGIPLYMASLLLDHPYMRINTIYNWREGPIIERSPEGSVRVRPGIIHHTRGHPFTG